MYRKERNEEFIARIEAIRTSGGKLGGKEQAIEYFPVGGLVTKPLPEALRSGRI